VSPYVFIIIDLPIALVGQTCLRRYGDKQIFHMALKPIFTSDMVGLEVENGYMKLVIIVIEIIIVVKETLRQQLIQVTEYISYIYP
jgi:hypothetical protein